MVLKMMSLTVFIIFVANIFSFATKANHVSVSREIFHRRQAWPPESADKCTQQTKQKAMYGKMTFSPSLSVKPMTRMEVIVRWDDLRFNPVSNPNKKGGVYVAYTTGMKNGPGGYFGPQITSRGGQFLFSIWDGDRFERRGGKKIPKASSQLAWPIHMSTCKRNCQDCGMSHLGDTRKKGLTTGAQCILKYPDMKVGDEFKIILRRVREKITINTATRGGMPKSHQVLGETDRSITGGLWEVRIRDMKRGKVAIVGKILFEGDGSGMASLGTFDEMLGCRKCNVIHHKDTRYGIKLDSLRNPRVPLKMQGTTRADGSTCKKYKITGSKQSHSISFEGGPFTPNPFPKQVRNVVIWE